MPAFFDVFGREEPSLEGNLRTHDAVVGRDATHARARLARGRCQWQVVHVFRACILHKWILEYRFGVLFFQKDPFARTLAAGLNTGLAAIRHHNAVRKRAPEANDERAIETVAIRHQQHDGDNSPGNTQHRHCSAKPMIDESSDGLKKDFFQDHRYISNLSASTGSSSAARRAG